jgi:hypothetical protein
MKVIHLPDLHTRNEKPFYERTKKFFQWIINNPEINSPDVILVQGGDLFHRSNPRVEAIELVLWFIKQLNVHIFILNRGNHGYDDDQKTFSIDSLVHENNVLVIKEPCFLEYGGIKMTFLPWLPNKKIKLYEERDIKINPDNTDLVFYHFPDETIYLGHESKKRCVNLSNYKGIKVGSDIHITSSSNYPGVCFPTKRNEAGANNPLFVYDSNNVSYISVPNFFDYQTIDYSIEEKLNPDNYYIINNAPSYELVRQKFSNYYILEINLSLHHTESEEVLSEEKESIIDYLDDFILNRKIDSKVADKLIEVFDRS